VLAALEDDVAAVGHRRIYLTTGPRQPEAQQLYLAARHTPLHDRSLDPEVVGPHPFEKHLGRSQP
jgi:hypothetical protein